MKFEVGMDVYVGQFGSWEWFYYQGKVVNITPKGMVDISIGSITEPVRFKANGQRLGDKYPHYNLDTIPFSERSAMLKTERSLKEIVRDMGQISIDAMVSYRSGKDGLVGELDRLQRLIDSARSKLVSLGQIEGSK